MNWRKALLKEAFVIHLLGKTSSWQFLGWNQSQRKNFHALTAVKNILTAVKSILIYESLMDM